MTILTEKLLRGRLAFFTLNRSLKRQYQIKETSKTLILFQMEDDISPTSLNVTAESNSKFKLVVNAYGCFESEMKTLKVIKLRNV